MPISIKNHRGCFQSSERETAIPLFEGSCSCCRIIHHRLFHCRFLWHIPLSVVVWCQVLYLASDDVCSLNAISSGKNLIACNRVTQRSFGNN